MDYKTWYKQIIWLQDKIILPSGERVSKKAYQTEKGFDIDKFNSMLFKEYNNANPVKQDGRRYKK